MKFFFLESFNCSNEDFSSNEQICVRMKYTNHDETSSLYRDIPQVSSTTSPTKNKSEYIHMENKNTKNLDVLRTQKLHDFQVDKYTESRIPESSTNKKKRNSKKRLQVSYCFFIFHESLI